MILYTLYTICVFFRIVLGFYCAHKMTNASPLWVRLVVLSPALSALFTVPDLLEGIRVVTVASVGRAISVVLIYVFVASLFSKRPWIDFYKNN